MTDVTRTLVIWFPDWPVRAHAHAEEIEPTLPIALVDHGLVFACSPSARGEGVRRGQRIREAQARCPELLVFDYDPALDHRSFEPIVSAIEELMPGVQLIRPGTCALRSRGPARYYGGEEEMAKVLFTALAALEISGSADPGVAEETTSARIAIADGRFAAEQAVRMRGVQSIRVVPAGGSPAFLAPQPIEAIGDPALATLLRRLGLTTLGDFAALDFRDVRARFGETGVYAHTLASGRDARRVVPRLPPQLRDIELAFEPPFELVDQVTFAFRTTAERFVEELTRALLVCTGIRVEIHTDNGGVHERSWGHPRWFSASDVLDRIRWQVQGRTGNGNGALGSPITKVRVLPEGFDSIGNYETGLWGSTPDDRVHHGLSRVQSLLGHGGVMTAAIGGGRGISERQILVPWGDPRPKERELGGKPWPGSIPLPAPSTVFERPRRVSVQAEDGGPVGVTERGVLTGVPARFSEESATPRLPQLTAWAGPWPVFERWWDQEQARSFHRFQVVDAEGTAWLLALHEHEWWAEARYD
ncbi:DNA polymerase Y family protein [Subtercola frigoramans]|uniref:Protein ImuB n=1 Tax=Subtercola frigoramans TaxID=120298 RepID=A0ABS2L5B5_9MICO|nr:DNA polymerase Y family protein [Subtercola frigoramans]MBM7472204.1 protein ImuB [Subtercola frigoramans]